MTKTLTSRKLRDNLEDIVEAVARGEEFLFIYRSKPAFKIVPIDSGDNLIAKSPTVDYGTKRRTPITNPEEIKRRIKAVQEAIRDEVKGYEDYEDYIHDAKQKKYGRGNDA